MLRNPLPSSLSTLLVFRLRFPFLSLPLHYHHLLLSLRQGGAEEEELSAFPTPKSRIASSSDADHTAANFSSSYLQYFFSHRCTVAPMSPGEKEGGRA